MMAARKFGVAERMVVEALVGQWPIVRLCDGAFRALMEALPDLGTHAGVRPQPRRGHRGRGDVRRVFRSRARSSTSRPTPSTCTSCTPRLPRFSRSRRSGHDTSIATYSFQFFDRAGDAAFKAFLWEGFPNVPAERIEAFHALTRRLSAEGS